MGGVISGLGGAIGANSNSGANWSPQSAWLQNPSTVQQADTAYDQTQSGIAQQQAFLQALQAQNGIQNQSNVYNQLQGVANGTGPNPAAAMLAQSTGANVANQAALMAGQRGAGSNVGLLARQAAQQGANTQQQAAGQAATMQANQSLGALGQLGGLSTAQVNQQQGAINSYNQAAQGQQSNLLNSINAQNQAAVGNAQQQNTAMSPIQQGIAKNQGQLAGGAMNAVGGALGMAEGGKVTKTKNYADGGRATVEAPQTPTIPKVNTAANVQPRSGKNVVAKLTGGLSQPNAPSNQGDDAVFQGSSKLFGAAGTGLKNLFSSSPGGSPDAPALTQPALGDSAYKTDSPNLGTTSDLSSTTPTVADSAGPNLMQGLTFQAHGGIVPARLSPGEVYLSPEKVKEVKKGKNPLAVGERIPGQAKVAGDSLKNDVVDKNLKEGGIVVKRTKAFDPKKAQAFVDSVIAQQKHKKK